MRCWIGQGIAETFEDHHFGPRTLGKRFFKHLENFLRHIVIVGIPPNRRSAGAQCLHPRSAADVHFPHTIERIGGKNFFGQTTEVLHLAIDVVQIQHQKAIDRL